MSDSSNIADFVVQAAQQRPNEPAIHVPRVGLFGAVSYTTYDYRTLDEQSTALALGLQELGVSPGQRVALMVRPGFELFAITFGLFKAGAVPVLIDPGIGVRRMGRCLEDARPEVFIGIPLAHVARILFGWGRSTVRMNITAGRFKLWGGHRLSRVIELGRGSSLTLPTMGPDDAAAVLFTSGSTGAPKGVSYRHRHFRAQVDLIRAMYDIRPGEIDLPTFPLFALFDPALQMTTVIPSMDPTRPARANPKRLIDAIERFGVTNMFGSPALLNTLGRHVEENAVQLPTLRRIISAGAAVPGEVMGRMIPAMADGGQVHTPYGATECLPVATISSDEVIGETQAATANGAGVCVGHPVAPNQVSIIAITDEAIEDWSQVTTLETGQIGEIVVRGPTTTQSYFGREKATALSKIGHDDRDWKTHRMGDLGYLDDRGRLWFCGRKAHRVETDEGLLCTVPIEMVFNTHSAVFRSALVGVIRAGKTQPLLCVELEKTAPPWQQVVSELGELAAHHEAVSSVTDFLRHPGFPVDIRHNAKINREALAIWAQGQIS